MTLSLVGEHFKKWKMIWKTIQK
jgi:hypothetical protein